MGLIPDFSVNEIPRPKKVIPVELCHMCKIKPVIYGTSYCSEVCRNSHLPLTSSEKNKLLAEYRSLRE